MINNQGIKYYISAFIFICFLISVFIFYKYNFIKQEETQDTIVLTILMTIFYIFGRDICYSYSAIINTDCSVIKKTIILLYSLLIPIIVVGLPAPTVDINLLIIFFPLIIGIDLKENIDCFLSQQCYQEIPKHKLLNLYFLAYLCWPVLFWLAFMYINE